MQPPQTISQYKANEMHFLVIIISLWFFLIVRRVRPKSLKRLTSTWANLSSIELDHRIKSTALYQSQGINIQNRVRLCQYSYWLLRNFSVNFDDQELIVFYDEGHCGRSIMKNGNPSHSFLFDVLGIFGPNFKAIRQIYIPYKFV